MLERRSAPDGDFRTNLPTPHAACAAHGLAAAGLRPRQPGALRGGCGL